MDPEKQLWPTLEDSDNASARNSNARREREEHDSDDRQQLAADVRSITSRLRRVDPARLSRADIQAVKALLDELAAYFRRRTDKRAGQ
jgi:hypothetical protein